MTKAQVLKTLKQKLMTGKILDLFVFSVQDWRSKKKECLESIISNFSHIEAFIVRSSAQCEDQLHASGAGKFDSFLDVSRSELSEAIDKVISSYGKNVKAYDEVLIQPMLKDVSMSGVLFSRDPNSDAPYYIINYETDGKTDAVTSGCGPGLKTCIIARSFKDISDIKFKKLINLVSELEEVLEYRALDIEFAFDKENVLFLLQVRPLINQERCLLESQEKILGKIKEKFSKLNAPHPYLYGDRTILGIMPDWNPAEIIGVRPKPLALSLYKELITDQTWAYQRDNYGYKNLRSFPLMIDLMGLPYIDVRVSFNSFLPKNIDSAVAEKLINYYLARLEDAPYLHDKIEFEVVFSCYTFDLKERINVLLDHGFSQLEIMAIVEGLRDITNKIVHYNKGLWLEDIKKIEELKKRHDLIFHEDSFDSLTKIYWLIQDCKRYGTLPFAGLARAGFIAMQILNSMVAAHILSPEQKASFLNSLNSVSSKMTKDLRILDRQEFLQIYGHLRPGTYDVLSLRYDEAPDTYFDWDNLKEESEGSKKEEFSLSLIQLGKIELLLKEQGLDHNVVDLFNFLKAAIEGREYSKFIFTKTLSDVLSLMKDFCKNNNMDLEDIAYLDIKDMLKIYSSSWDILEGVKKSIATGKEHYNITGQVILPPLIIHEKDLSYFELPDNQPNFVTRKIITALVVKDLNSPEEMEGAIVFIPNADPGYDWIFTRNIAGFITAYGGANSHMAIRASELGLPAIVGAGEKLYQHWKEAHKLYLDCMNQRVEILH